MEKLHSILLPTDFSKEAAEALQYAVKMACRTNALLYIFHAYRIPLVADSGTGVIRPPMGPVDYDQVAYDQLKTLQKEFSGELNRVKYEVVAKPGSLPEALLLFKQTTQIDLIIMGTKGAEGFQEFFIGSNTADVANTIDIPVLVIPEKVSFKGLKQLAFAYDYKGIDDPRKLDILEYLSKTFNSEMHILNISESMEPHMDDDMASLDILEQKFGNIKHDYKTRPGSDVEKGINDYVDYKNIDLLAVMPRKHNLFEKLFRKSIANEMTYHTKIPLLMLKN